VYRRLAVLAGRLDDLLTSREHDGRERDFLAVTLTDTVRPEGAMDKLRARFPHILTLEFRPEGLAADPRGYRERVAGRDDLAVAAEFVSHVRGGIPSAGECDLLEQAFTAVRVAQEANG
jgi:exonuclease SbcD